MHKVSTGFLKIITSELQYGLHFANVATRRDPHSGRCTRSTTLFAYYLHHITLPHAIMCRMGVTLHPILYNKKFLCHLHTSVQTLRLNNGSAKKIAEKYSRYSLARPSVISRFLWGINNNRHRDNPWRLKCL